MSKETCKNQKNCWHDPACKPQKTILTDELFTELCVEIKGEKDKIMSKELIPVSERMPESDDILCVIWVIDDYEFGWWYEGTNCWDSPDKGWIPASDVTYWFPLPDDPKI